MQTRILFLSIAVLLAACTSRPTSTGQTTICTWQGNKQSAISITYDDGTIHQFTVARPIMNRLGLPATFYIITGKVPGSAQGKFIGRDKAAIIRETASIPTNADNFFERASLIGFSGMDRAVNFHSEAGSLFEAGKIDEAYAVMDSAYTLVRSQQAVKPEGAVFHHNTVDTTTWEDYKAYAAEGHEIASHTVTHPRLAVLDEANMLYELEQSKADIRHFLGEKYTFSAECPYGTEDERVMEYAHNIYPALRNRMPEPWLVELNRSSKAQPGQSDKEYVQWQRGPLTSISMEVMKSWVDTCLAHDNIWLVLVFHGVDGIGWEPRTGAELQEYFSYIQEREPQLWVATFADVTQYLRKRKNTTVTATLQDGSVHISLASDLDPAVYDVPLTFKTYVPDTWKTASRRSTTQTESQQRLAIQTDAGGPYVLYDVLPTETELVISE